MGWGGVVAHVILVSALGPNPSFFLFWGTFIQLGGLLGQGPGLGLGPGLDNNNHIYGVLFSTTILYLRNSQDLYQNLTHFTGRACVTRVSDNELCPLSPWWPGCVCRQYTQTPQLWKQASIYLVQLSQLPSGPTGTEKRIVFKKTIFIKLENTFIFKHAQKNSLKWPLKVQRLIIF